MTVARQEATLVRKIEKAGQLVVGVLLIYRLIFGTALDFFLLTSTTMLAVYYLWMGFFIFTNAIPSDITDRKKRAAFTPTKIAVSIAMGVVYSVCIITILYAVFFYPRMEFMLGFSSGLVLVSLGFIGIYYWFHRTEWLFLKQFFIRTAVIGCIIVLIMAVPLNSRLKVLYRKHPGFIEAYNAYHADPDSEEALELLREERSKFR